MLSKILKLPLQILMLAVLIASYYAAFKNIQGINFSAPIILTLIYMLYGLGTYLDNKTPEATI